MNPYYQSLLNDIESMIQEGRFADALRIVTEELSMPYVERDALEALRGRQADCMAHVDVVSKHKEFDLDALIRGSEAQKEKAVSLLKQMNLRLMEREVQTLLDSIPEITGHSFFFSTLVSLFTIVLNGGYYVYCMGIRQGLRMPCASLADGLSVAGKLIWCWIQISVRVALWSMLFVIPGLIAAYRYRFAYYNILTDGSLSASEAIALSSRQTAGMKMDLFVLDLSFIGWEIVSNLTYGLLNIWLMPYKTLAELAYFEEGQRRMGRSPYGGASGGQSGTPWEF